jgi:hypothetical protein
LALKISEAGQSREADAMEEVTGRRSHRHCPSMFWRVLVQRKDVSASPPRCYGSRVRVKFREKVRVALEVVVLHNRVEVFLLELDIVRRDSGLILERIVDAILKVPLERCEAIWYMLIQVVEARLAVE